MRSAVLLTLRFICEDLLLSIFKSSLEMLHSLHVLYTLIHFTHFQLFIYIDAKQKNQLSHRHGKCIFLDFNEMAIAYF